MSEDKSPLEQAMDLFVYAPLGLALTARDQLPSLIEKGRQQLTSQVAMARMMGQFAVAEGEKELRKVVEQAGETVNGLLQQPAAPRAASQSSKESSPKQKPASAAASNGKASPSGATATGDHLAITGYDTLSASQVVQRLAGLEASELEAVRHYEEQTRGRRTILSKIGQLQGGSAP